MVYVRGVLMQVFRCIGTRTIWTILVVVVLNFPVFVLPRSEYEPVSASVDNEVLFSQAGDLRAADVLR